MQCTPYTCGRSLTLTAAVCAAVADVVHAMLSVRYGATDNGLLLAIPSLQF